MASPPDWFPNFLDHPVDFTETRSFVFGLVQVGLSAVEFYLIFFVLVATGVLTRTMLDADPSSKGVTILLGFLPALALGAGVPTLVQRRAYFNRLNTSIRARLGGVTLTFGTYLGLFFYHPVASAVYAVTYLSARLVVLVGIYGGARVKRVVD